MQDTPNQVRAVRELQDAPQVQPQMPPAPEKAPPPVGKSDTNRPIIITAVILGIGILLFAFLYVKSSMQPKEEALVRPTPTIIPTPTPPPNLSRISTTSAFISYSEEVASFSAILNGFTLQDSTLTPPVLDVELNLSP